MGVLGPNASSRRVAYCRGVAIFAREYELQPPEFDWDPPYANARAVDPELTAGIELAMTQVEVLPGLDFHRMAANLSVTFLLELSGLNLEREL